MYCTEIHKKQICQNAEKSTSLKKLGHQKKLISSRFSERRIDFEEWTFCASNDEEGHIPLHTAAISPSLNKKKLESFP